MLAGAVRAGRADPRPGSGRPHPRHREAADRRRGRSWRRAAVGAALLGDRPQVRVRAGRPRLRRQARPDQRRQGLPRASTRRHPRHPRRLLRDGRRRSRVHRDPHRCPARRAAAGLPRRVPGGHRARRTTGPRHGCSAPDRTVDFGLLGPNAKSFHLPDRWPGPRGDPAGRRRRPPRGAEARRAGHPRAGLRGARGSRDPRALPRPGPYASPAYPGLLVGQARVDVP